MQLQNKVKIFGVTKFFKKLSVFFSDGVFLSIIFPFNVQQLFRSAALIWNQILILGV